MGTSISWIAVEGKPAASVLETLELTDTGRPARLGDCKIVGGTLPDGRFVVVFDEFWHRKIHADWMEAVSEGCVVVGCSEYDNVNSSIAFLFRNGELVWHVFHALDQGDDHLEIEGKAPSSAKVLLNEAKKTARKERYDAVFGVPAQMAQEACGFSNDQLVGLALTQLVAQVRIPGARALAAIIARLEGLLHPLGFAKRRGGDEFTHYTADSEAEEIECQVRFSLLDEGGCLVYLDFRVSNHRVQSLISAALPDAGEPAVTYWDKLPDAIGLPTAIKRNEQLDAWLAIAESELPRHIGRLRCIEGLDALANDGRPRWTILGEPTLSHYDYQTGFGKLVVAYLAGNPNFERMVVETDSGTTGGPSPSNSVHKLAAHLRRLRLRRPS